MEESFESQWYQLEHWTWGCRLGKNSHMMSVIRSSSLPASSSARNGAGKDMNVGERGEEFRAREGRAGVYKLATIKHDRESADCSMKSCRNLVGRQKCTQSKLWLKTYMQIEWVGFCFNTFHHWSAGPRLDDAPQALNWIWSLPLTSSPPQRSGLIRS